ELQEPLWQTMTRSLSVELKKNVLLDSAEKCSAWQNATSVLNMSSRALEAVVEAKLKLASEALASQLSLQCKLRLRAAFGSAAPMARVDGLQSLSMIETRRGLTNLRMFAGDAASLADQFVSQLNAETRTAVERVCQDKLSQAVPNLFGLPQL